MNTFDSKLGEDILGILRRKPDGAAKARKVAARVESPDFDYKASLQEAYELATKLSSKIARLAGDARVVLEGLKLPPSTEGGDTGEGDDDKLSTRHRSGNVQGKKAVTTATFDSPLGDGILKVIRRARASKS